MQLCTEDWVVLSYLYKTHREASEEVLYFFHKIPDHVALPLCSALVVPSYYFVLYQLQQSAYYGDP